METKQPRRLKFWLLVILGYIVLFVVGFTLPVLMNSITGGAQRETTKTAKVASSSSIKKNQQVRMVQQRNQRRKLVMKRNQALVQLK